MDINIFAQTLFYFVSSIAIIVVASFLAVMAYHLIKILKNVESLSDKLKEASNEAIDKFKALAEMISHLPFINYFIKKRANKERKGRKK